VGVCVCIASVGHSHITGLSIMTSHKSGASHNDMIKFFTS